MADVLKIIPPSSSTSEGANAEKSSVNVHHGVSCDDCGVSPIVGTRWKSTTKHDFDLCQPCFAKEGKWNEYLRIDEPKFRPRHLQVPYCPSPPGFSPMGPSPPFSPIGTAPMGPQSAFPPMGPPFATMGPRSHYQGAAPPPFSPTGTPPMGPHSAFPPVGPPFPTMGPHSHYHGAAPPPMGPQSALPPMGPSFPTMGPHSHYHGAAPPPMGPQSTLPPMGPSFPTMGPHGHYQGVAPPPFSPIGTTSMGPQSAFPPMGPPFPTMAPYGHHHGGRPFFMRWPFRLGRRHRGDLTMGSFVGVADNKTTFDGSATKLVHAGNDTPVQSSAVTSSARKLAAPRRDDHDLVLRIAGVGHFRS